MTNMKNPLKVICNDINGQMWTAASSSASNFAASMLALPRITVSYAISKEKREVAGGNRPVRSLDVVLNSHV